MSMDALTSAALDNLQKSALPKLLKAISALHNMPPEARAASDDLRAICAESTELLSLLLKWMSQNSTAAVPQSEHDIEIAGMDDLSADSVNMEAAESHDIDIAMGGDVDATTEASGELSDEEARRMLEDMDAPAAPAPAEASGELSDEEARRMLAEMDAPAAPAPVEASGELSDEEARRMLAEMDAPAAPAPAEASGELSDEEARRMLAEMDAPAAPVQAATPKAGATKSAAEAAEDEAMALLAAMGGLDDSAPTTAAPKAAAPAPKPAAAAAPAAAAHDHGGEDIGEIKEWESNDFASDPDMMNDFQTNSADIMQTLDDNVLRLEQDPTNKETIEEIFRAAHTLKGAAGMFGFRAIERVMHRMENLFDNVRRGKLVPNSDTIDAVFVGLDCLKKLLAAVLAQTPSGMKTAPVVRMLELASAGKPSGASRSGGGEQAPQAAAAPSGDGGGHDDGAMAHGGGGGGGGGAPKKKSEAASTIRVDLERLDALVNLIGELVIDRTRFVNIDESLRVQAPHLKLAGSMTETLQQFGRHMNEIQDIIMKVRMVPVGTVFNKYPRIVRDLARQLGKQIDLVLEGEETEFDKTLVEQIGDPLVHLIRNACDHGVETPAERTAARKSPNGTVTLSARQEGNHIIIQITDDGKGMDVNRIKAKAIEKGLITADQVLTEREVFNLIFEPGFSTAEKVTTVSGRGVGMDVVKKQIAKLKGLVEISSAPGKGSTITIQLPLTLAIMQSLLVGVQEEVLAIPLSAVVESIRIKPKEIQKVGDSEVIKLRNSVLPLIYLDEVLDLNVKTDQYWYRHPDQVAYQDVVRKRQAKRKERLYVVVVGTAEQRYGLVVDSLMNQQEMVIKPLGSLLRGNPCVAGGAVLGNGEVVLVMDIPEVEAKYRAKRRALSAA